MPNKEYTWQSRKFDISPSIYVILLLGEIQGPHVGSPLIGARNEIIADLFYHSACGRSSSSPAGFHRWSSPPLRLTIGLDKIWIELNSCLRPPNHPRRHLSLLRLVHHRLVHRLRFLCAKQIYNVYCVTKRSFRMSSQRVHLCYTHISITVSSLVVSQSW